MGGDSAERVISLETGRAVHAALCRKGVNALAIDAKDDVIGQLKGKKIDRVFNALHGRGGEDGVIQGVLESLSLPYTGSGVLGSALAMDKIRSKRLWREMGLSTSDFLELESETDLYNAARKIGLPLMVKPVHEGSSCGASKVNSLEDVSKAWQLASQFQDSVMAEKWINGVEYTIGILDQQVLPIIKLQTPHEFYDYQAKYEVDSTEYICPCGLTEEDEKRVQDIAMRAFIAIGASGWGRVDLFIDEAEQVQLLEVNTVPGMTGHSLVPMAAKQVGLEFDDLVLKILDTSVNRRVNRETAVA
ncbi:MAG: D-alanine--D-alanine ligase [Gammaproteobacteria bacterium]|nr:D-alanine--D-alanine ligase [Gammaproteobacteria bacterium]